jgi:hypothetical protein
MARGTARVNFSHNVDQVIDDIDDVKDDLHDIFDVVMGMMQVVMQDARVFIEQDADYQGNLRRSLETDTQIVSNGRRKISVQTDASIAPYAALIEFGTGARTEISVPGGSIQTAPTEALPPGVPFETPDITEDTEQFDAFVAHIRSWMEKKGDIEPRYGPVASAVAVAKTIIDQGQYAHPFLRPAWFKNERALITEVKRAVRRAAR